MYEAAQSREQQLRTALAQHPGEGSAGLREFRAAIDSYRAVVWRYPTSGYCDNALWQGAHLAADAFDRFGQDRDRQLAASMLRALVSEYPSSGFVEKARAEAADLEAPSSKAPPVAAPTPKAGAPPSTSEAVRDSTGRKDASGVREPGVVSVQAISRIVGPEAVQVTIELDGPVTYHEERLEQPPRVFFDLANTRTVDALRDAVLAYETDIVRQIRVGRHPNQVTRVVLDLEGVRRYRARILPGPYRLVVDCYRAATSPEAGTGAPTQAPATEGAANPTLPKPKATPDAGAHGVPAPAAPRRAPIAALTNPEPPLAPPTIHGILLPLESGTSLEISPPRGAHPAPGRAAAPPAPTLPEAPASNLSGGYSLARQLGLGVGRIVIDPGHGGRDPGALGAGATEADMTLDIALRLEKLLLKEPGIDVVMTRRTDVYVPLEERTAIANRAGADLFLSIHCNAARDASIHGVETYSLNFASTAHAATVAARENAAAALPMGSLSEIVRVIALNSKVDESRDLARQVQLALVRRLRVQFQALRDLGVKQAPFVVLIGASMPSVLAEVAFITNRQEGRLLASASYRQRAAEALLEGINRYQRSLKKDSVPLRQPIAR